MADKHFLDYDGLSQFFNGLKQKFYQKPSGGIPKSDLASAVQTSLGKADSALQSHQDISGKLDKSGGTMSGALNMGSKKITSLATPTNNADAATKKYVDDATAHKVLVGAQPPSDTNSLWVCTVDRKIKCYDAQSSSWIEANAIFDGEIKTSKIADDAVTESKLSSSARTSLNKAHEHSNKAVLDFIDELQVQAWNSTLPLAGGVMQGNIDMTAHDLIFTYGPSVQASISPGAWDETDPSLVLEGLKINSQTGVSTDADVILKGVATPVNNTDAANKAYVDSKVSQSGHTHSNKSVLDGITSSKVSAWDAKASTSYVDSAVSNKATTSYVDSAISTAVASAVVYKGSKSAVANLPSSGNKTGDMWNVSADGMNYVWDGTKWDAQAPTFSITAITSTEIDTILAST